MDSAVDSYWKKASSTTVQCFAASRNYLGGVFEKFLSTFGSTKLSGSGSRGLYKYRM